MRTWPFSGGNFGSSAGSLSQAGYMVVVFSEVPRQPFGFGPENVGLIFPMIASHLKTG